MKDVSRREAVKKLAVGGAGLAALGLAGVTAEGSAKAQGQTRAPRSLRAHSVVKRKQDNSASNPPHLCRMY